MKAIVLGSFEEIGFPELYIDNVVAKIDTGAYSGALYCTDIEIVKEDDRKILRFKVLGEMHYVYEGKFRRARVRSATGHEVKRFIISTKIRVKDTVYPINIGLADRNSMKYPVLLGRRFLREHNMIVDTRINQEFDHGEDGKR